MSVTFTLSIIISIICAVVCYRIAIGKGRGPALWAILGFFFSVIALIVIAVLPSKNPAR